MKRLDSRLFKLDRGNQVLNGFSDQGVRILADVFQVLDLFLRLRPHAKSDLSREP